MNKRQLKVGYFVLEGLNAFSTTFFFNYLFFHMRDRFGTGSAGNLCLSALNGLVYMVVVWRAGTYAQRAGYFTALRWGFSVLALSLAVGSQLQSEWGQYFVVACWTFGLCFTWPTLEALASENESPAGLQRMVGIYNIVWATGSAAAYFLGGALIRALGTASLYWLPVALHGVQLALLYRLESKRAARTSSPIRSGLQEPLTAVPLASPAIPLATHSARAQGFLQLAWVANPFAYVAINSVIPVIPDVASRLHLSLALAGFFCSIWYFARLAAFIMLWLWSGWHYRFRWLMTAYLLLIASFLTLLLVPNLWVVIVAQVFFGFCVGFAYYSSLYYSMDVGKASSEHGGVHEAAIGAGVFGGPALGAATLQFYPQYPAGNAWAVSTLMVSGAVAILVLRFRMGRRA